MLSGSAPAKKASSSAGPLPSEAPIAFDIHPYGASAGDQVNGWPAGVPCLQVQMVHSAYPSMTAFFLEAFDAFLAGRVGEGDLPKSLKEFQQKCFFRVQITRADDELPDVPLAPWRLVIYTAGRSEALTDLIGLLMEYARYRAENPLARDRKPFPDPDEQKLEVYLGEDCPQLGAKVSDLEKVEISHGRNLYHWSEAAGPAGNKFLFMDLEVEETGKIALGWRGRTWPLRNEFDIAQIPLMEDGEGGFVRVLKGEGAAIDSDILRKSLIDVLTMQLRGFPTIVLAEKIPEKGGEDDEDVFCAARDFVDMLRSIPQFLVKDVTGEGS